MDNSVLIPKECEVTAMPEQCQGCECDPAEHGPLKPYLAETLQNGFIQAWWCLECAQLADTEWCDFLQVMEIS